MRNDMDHNSNGDSMNDWVDQCLGRRQVPPDWEPHIDRAFARVIERQHVSTARRRTAVWIGILFVLVASGFAAFPPTRTLAERLWLGFSQTNVEVVRIKNSYEPPPE